MVEKSRVESVLQSEETVEETIETANRSVVVTDQRVLAFTPEQPGKNFRETNRLNVSAVKPGTITRSRLGEWAVTFGILAVMFVVADLLVDFGDVGDTFTGAREGAEAFGIGWVVDILGLIGLLDVVLLPAGAVCAIGAVYLGRRYWQDRYPAVIVAAAGTEDDVKIPWPEETETTMDVGTASEQLRDAISFTEEWESEDSEFESGADSGVESEVDSESDAEVS